MRSIIDLKSAVYEIRIDYYFHTLFFSLLLIYMLNDSTVSSKIDFQ